MFHEVRIYDALGNLKEIVPPEKLFLRGDPDLTDWPQDEKAVPSEYGTCAYRECGRTFYREPLSRQYCNDGCKAREQYARRVEKHQSHAR